MTTGPQPAVRWEPLIVGVLLAFALAVRLVGLGSAPNGLFRDEWEKGYTALELWETGRHGVLGPEGVRVSYPVPLFIEVFAGHDRTSSTYQWLAAPVVGIFGLEAWSTRLPAALTGFATVLLLWWSARRWLGAVGAVAVLGFLAVQPTHVLFSRWAQQGIVSIALASAGVVGMLIAIQAAGARRRLTAIGAGLLMGLAAWAYDPVRLTLPLAFVMWAGLLGFWRHREATLAAGVAFLCLWLPLAAFTLTAGSGRLGRVLSTGDGAALQFVLNYLAHFDPRFWFVSGDLNPRHALPLAGWSGRVTGLLALVGLLMVGRDALRNRKLEEWSLMGAALLLCGPVAAALTREGIPHALRSGLMIPGVVMLAGFAVSRLAELYGGRAAGMALAAALLIDGATTTAGVLRLREPSPAWESGVIETLRAVALKPGPVHLSSEVMYAPYAALFAGRTDPARFQEFGLAAGPIVLVQPGSQPVGGTLVAPPRPPLRLEWTSFTVMAYRADGRYAWSDEARQLVQLEPND